MLHSMETFIPFDIHGLKGERLLLHKMSLPWWGGVKNPPEGAALGANSLSSWNFYFLSTKSFIKWIYSISYGMIFNHVIATRFKEYKSPSLRMRVSNLQGGHPPSGLWLSIGLQNCTLFFGGLIRQSMAYLKHFHLSQLQWLGTLEFFTTLWTLLT